MRSITYDTVMAVFTGLTKAQKERLSKLSYTKDDMKSAESMYEALRPCSNCHLNEKILDNRNAEIHRLKQNREFFDEHFRTILDAIERAK